MENKLYIRQQICIEGDLGMTSAWSIILGFVQYLSGDVSSNSTTNDNDNRMYGVIQCSAKPLRTSCIDKHFITTFHLGTNYDSFDVVPVESMMHPMLAVPSFGSTGDELYVTATSYEQWGKYFENEMRRIHCEEDICNTGDYWKRL